MLRIPEITQRQKLLTHYIGECIYKDFSKPFEITMPEKYSGEVPETVLLTEIQDIAKKEDKTVWHSFSEVPKEDRVYEVLAINGCIHYSLYRNFWRMTCDNECEANEITSSYSIEDGFSYQYSGWCEIQ